MHDVNIVLAKRNLQQLPTHLYAYLRENGPFTESKENKLILGYTNDKHGILSVKKGNRWSSNKGVW